MVVMVQMAIRDKRVKRVLLHQKDRKVKQEQMDQMVLTVQMVTKDRKEIKVKQEQQVLKPLL